MTWWLELPQGYYAVSVDDPDVEDPETLGCLIVGYSTCRRTRSGFRMGATYTLPGADLEVVSRNAWTAEELGDLLLTDPDYYRGEFGRFTGKCGRCGRKLTDPDSKVRGIGPDCWALIGGAS